MVNIYEILLRAASLKEETTLNSISPERAGGIMYDTLLALNDLWLQQGSALVISKIYASVAAMEADTAPVSDLTGKPLRPGQIVVIASSDSDNGSVYRYNGTDAPSWSLVGAIGSIPPVDSLDSDSTTLPLAAHQGKVLDGKIGQLGQEIEPFTNTDFKKIVGLPNTIASWGGSYIGRLEPYDGYTTFILAVRTTMLSVTINGAVPLYYFRYSDFPSQESYIDSGRAYEQQPVSCNSCVYLLFIFEDSNNTGGYGNLSFAVKSSIDNELSETKEELQETKNKLDLTNLTMDLLGGKILSGYVAVWGGSNVGGIEQYVGWSCLCIPVNNLTPCVLSIYNATVGNNSRFLLYSGVPSHDTYVNTVDGSNNSAIIPAGTKYVIVNFEDAENTGGYNYLIHKLSAESAKDSAYCSVETLNLGVNTGLAFAWFNNKYPNKTQVAIELFAWTDCVLTASFYGLKTRGTLNDGYTTIAEGINNISLKGKKRYNFFFDMPDGYNYLMANFIADAGNTIQIDAKAIPNSGELGITLFKNLASNALLLADKINEITDFKADLERDEYVVFAGDSICAFQSAYSKAEDGVTRVPATCDKQANAYHFWKASKWGNVVCRRFDDGKASLVSNWDSRWQDDSEAFFIESGTFHTQYARNGYQASQDAIQITTHIDNGYFSNLFDESETTQQQRNIPKRFSNESGASITFTIPSGYKKFDLLYHAHVDGDTNVTIAISSGNGKVKYNTKPNDWANAQEANGATIDLSLEPWKYSAIGGNDAYGTPNKRIHFEILDSDGCIITLTKSSDTSKYLIYQSVEYWGTTAMPYALHLDNMAVGGYNMQGIAGIRQQVFRASQPTAILLEFPFNDLSNFPFTNRATTEEKLGVIKGLIDEMNVPFSMWIPHYGRTGISSEPEQTICNYQNAEKIIAKNNIPYIGSVASLFANIKDVFFENSPLSEIISLLTMDGVHPNYEGFQIYRGFWNKVIK